MTRKVLITGASGFIGSHLARACLARGDVVTAVMRPASDPWRLRDVTARVDVQRCDLTNRAAVLALLRDSTPDVVFHLAAGTRYPKDDSAAVLARARVDNLEPLKSLIAACEIVPPSVLIRTGTIAEYGDADLPYLEEEAAQPVDIYGRSMLEATRYLSEAQSRLPFAVRTARLALTYGPAQNPDFLVPQLLAACVRGETVTLQQPEDRRDLIHVDDVVRGLLTLADKAYLARPVTNLSSGKSQSVRKVAQVIRELTGAAPGLIRLGTSQAPPRELRSSATRAQETLGWAAEIPLKEGLRRTTEWMRAHERAEAMPMSQSGTAAR